MGTIWAIYTIQNHLTLPTTVGIHRQPPLASIANRSWLAHHCRYMTSFCYMTHAATSHASSPRYAYTEEKKKTIQTIQTLMQVALHVQQIFMQVLLYNIQTIFPILSRPRSSCSKLRPPSTHPRVGFKAIVADESANMPTAVCAWGVEPIITPIDCFSEIKSLTIGSKTPEIDHLLDSLRFRVLVDANALDNIRDGSFSSMGSSASNSSAVNGVFSSSDSSGTSRTWVR